MSKRAFLRVILVVLVLSATLMGWELVRAAQWQTEQVSERLLDSFAGSSENTSDMSQSAQQIAAVFHTSAQAMLLDAAGEPVMQTQEFLLLRDLNSSPSLAVLNELSETDRAALRSAASKDEAKSRRILALASAFRYESYLYGDVVYPHTMLHAQESQAVSVPIALKLQSTATDDIVEAELLAAESSELPAGAQQSSMWLPYLREKPVDTTRLLELIDGAEPKQSLLYWEHFQTMSVPESLGASQLAAYTATHPLWDAICASVGDLAIWLVCTLVLAAVLALGLDRLVHRYRKNRKT